MGWKQYNINYITSIGWNCNVKSKVGIRLAIMKYFHFWRAHASEITGIWSDYVHNTWYIFIMYIVQCSSMLPQPQVFWAPKLTIPVKFRTMGCGVQWGQKHVHMHRLHSRAKSFALKSGTEKAINKGYLFHFTSNPTCCPCSAGFIRHKAAASQGHGPNPNDRWNNQNIHEDTVCIELLIQYFHHSYSGVNILSVIWAEQKNYKQKKQIQSIVWKSFYRLKWTSS